MRNNSKPHVERDRTAKLKILVRQRKGERALHGDRYGTHPSQRWHPTSYSGNGKCKRRRSFLISQHLCVSPEFHFPFYGTYATNVYSNFIARSARSRLLAFSSAVCRLVLIWCVILLIVLLFVAGCIPKEFDRD